MAKKCSFFFVLSAASTLKAYTIYTNLHNCMYIKKSTSHDLCSEMFSVLDTRLINFLVHIRYAV